MAIAGLSVVPTALLPPGFFWLGERGWLGPFVVGCVVGCVVVGGLTAGLRWWARRRLASHAAPDPLHSLPADLAARPSDDWSARETEVFRRVRAGIEARAATPRPWEALPQLALDVVDEMAEGLGGRRVLDLTLPEALLLVERTASRYRAHMRRRVPFADTVSIGTMKRLWRHRTRLRGAHDLVTAAQRIVRVASQPPAGLGRGIERLVTGGDMARLREQMIGAGRFPRTACLPRRSGRWARWSWPWRRIGRGRRPSRSARRSPAGPSTSSGPP